MLQEKRHVIPFDKVFKAEWEEQFQDGWRWIIGTACFIDSWNLRNTFVPDDGSRSCSKFKMKAKQYNESANRKPFYSSLLVGSENRSCESFWTRRMKKISRRACLAQGIDFASMDMMCTWCYFVSHDMTQHNLWLSPGPHDSHDSHDFFILFPPSQRIAFLKVSQENEGLKASEPWRWLKQGSSAQHVLAPGSCNWPLQKLRLFTPENSAICLSTIQM